MKSIVTMPAANIIAVKQPMMFNLRRYLFEIVICIVCLVTGYFVAVERNELVQEANARMQRANATIETLQTQVVKLENENKELQQKIDSALIPESSVGEAASVHVVAPVKRAATSAYNTAAEQAGVVKSAWNELWK